MAGCLYKSSEYDPLTLQEADQAEYGVLLSYMGRDFVVQIHYFPLYSHIPADKSSQTSRYFIAISMKSAKMNYIT